MGNNEKRPSFGLNGGFPLLGVTANTGDDKP